MTHHDPAAWKTCAACGAVFSGLTLCGACRGEHREQDRAEFMEDIVAHLETARAWSTSVDIDVPDLDEVIDELIDEFRRGDHVGAAARQRVALDSLPEKKKNTDI